MQNKSNYIFRAFTLAEVLITLAVIGIVAALSIPNLVQSYKKRVVETRLARFYSMINQALKMSEVDNGPKEYWATLYTNQETQDTNTLLPEDWYNKYLKNYLKVLKVETSENFERKVSIYFLDGSMAHFSGSSWIFYPNANDYTETTQEYNNEDVIIRDKEVSGIKYFTFMYRANEFGLIPYGYDNSTYNNIETIKSDSSIGCTKEMPSNERALCALWIMKNGWKIPDDYPLKF